MNTRKILLLFSLPVALACRVAAADPQLDIVITANDSMKFNVTKIEAHSGQVIHVELQNQGTLPKEAMGHNWILLKAGRDAAAYAAAATAAVKESYQPSSHADDVLAFIPLLGPKKSGEVTFAAPAEPGRYVYLCSFPAHFQVGMKGELIVK